MPTYDYRCSSCGHEFEEFQSMSAKALVKCPECGKNSLERLIGIGAGVLFKGGGFYETDYRSESYKKGVEAEKKSAEPKSEAGGGSCACGKKHASQCGGGGSNTASTPKVDAPKKKGSKSKD